MTGVASRLDSRVTTVSHGIILPYGARDADSSPDLAAIAENRVRGRTGGCAGFSGTAGAVTPEGVGGFFWVGSNFAPIR